MAHAHGVRHSHVVVGPGHAELMLAVGYPFGIVDVGHLPLAQVDVQLGDTVSSPAPMNLSLWTLASAARMATKTYMMCFEDSIMLL